jgi:threonylcarbamoyladenosine tRNA methylthiotransferase MtaB
MFARSLDLVEECGLTWLHVFPFSPRAGTPAARMPQVPGPAVRERAQRLRAAGAERVRAHLAAMQGRDVELLMERPDLGRTEGFAQTLVAGEHRPGAVVRARVTGAREGMLVAEAA